MLWAIVIAVGALGLAAAAVGLRGRRINDHPICRGCGFDLVGLGGRSEGEGGGDGEGSTDLQAGQSRGGRCPECGRELSGRRAVRMGARRRRRVVLVAGLLLLLTGAAWTGVLLWGRAQSFDWNTVKPTWLLMMETRQPTGENADAGMQELVKRLEAGSLDAGRIETIAQRILEAQGDLDWPWHGSWGRFFEAAHEQGALSDDQRLTYARQALAGAIEPYEMTYRNDSLQWGIRVNITRVAGGYNERFRGRIQIESLTIDGQTHDVAFRSFPGIYGGTSSATKLEQIALPPGKVDVVMRGTVEVIEGFAVDGESLDSWPLTLETTLEAPAQNPITWIDDPELHPVWQTDSRQTPSARAVEGGAIIQGFLHMETSVGLVSDVYVRDGEREWKIGRFKLPAGYRGGAGLSPSETLEGFDAERVDIILRTVEDEEPDASWPAEVWRGEVIFEDVPLQWTGGGR